MHFYVHDAMETTPSCHLALGEGEVNVLERLKLAEKRKAGCVMETKTIEALRQSVAWLQ